MIHAFESELAKEYGILEAILLNYFAYWLEKNEANHKHFHDGKWWTYNSAMAFAKIFPYASPKQIRTALEHLKEAGLIETGDYNEDARDRTLWYAFTEKGKCIFPTRQMQITYEENANSPQGKPLPINNTINNTINKQEYIGDQKPKRKSEEFTPPSLEEVRAYCEERNKGVNPNRWFDYYTSVGWVVGKNKKMKDWKAAVRNWEKDTTPKKERRSDLDDIF